MNKAHPDQAPAANPMIERHRLTGRLGTETAPVSWLSGRAGAGKTTVLKSWVATMSAPCIWVRLHPNDETPAHLFATFRRRAELGFPDIQLPSIPPMGAEVGAFAANFFQLLDNHIGTAFTVIFDNGEIVPASVWREVLTALDATTLGRGRVIVATRQAPPSGLARQEAYGLLNAWSDDTFLLDDEEAHALCALIAPKFTPEQRADAIARADGWAAGLRLLLTQDFGGARDVFAALFAEEIVPNLSTSEREALFLASLSEQSSTAILDEALASASADHDEGATRLIAELRQRGLLAHATRGDADAVSLHALYRAPAIGALGPLLSPDRRTSLLRAYTAIEVRDGRVPNAVRLAIEAQAYELASDLLLTHGPQLLALGSNDIVVALLRALPESIFQSPPVMFLYAAAALVTNPVEARKILAPYWAMAAASVPWSEMKANPQAHAQTWTQTLTTWSLVVDGYILSRAEYADLNPYLDEIEPTVTPIWPQVAEAVGPAVAGRFACSMFAALVTVRPDNPHLSLWYQMVRGMADVLPDAFARILILGHIGNYHYCTGDGAGIGFVDDRARLLAEHANPAVKATALVLRSIAAWKTHRVEDAHRFVEAGFEIARRTGIGFWTELNTFQGVYASLLSNDVDKAQSYLDRLEPPRPLTQAHAHFHHLVGVLELWRGRAPQARACGAMATETTRQLDLPFGIGLHLLLEAQALATMEQWDEAEQVLNEIDEVNKRARSHILTVDGGLTRAYIELARGARANAVAATRHALIVARTQQCFPQPVFHSPLLTPVLSLALDEHLECELVRELIQLRALPIPAAPPDDWPVKVRIRLLGKLCVERDDSHEALELSKKPLELVAALALEGGTDVPRTRIIDLLWPDADGDRANAALKTTVARVRKTLGGDAIVLDAGVLSLNRKHVFVDVVALRQHLRTRSPVRHLSALYRGPLLTSLAALPWVASHADALANDAAEAFIAHGRDAGDDAGRIAILETGTTLLPQSQELAFALAQAWAEQNERANARTAIERLRTLLATTGGTITLGPLNKLSEQLAK